jgi:head-tail adaptor
MDAGQLKYRITLRQPTVVGNDFGTKQDTTYVDYVTIYAKLVDVGGNKTVLNYELFTSHICQFEVRYRTDFDETYQIRFNNRLYQILSIKEKEFKKTMVITADLLQ